MFHNKAPFPGKNMEEVKMKFSKKEIIFKKDIHPEITKWVVKMLQIYPKQRPNIQEILSQPYFKSFQKSNKSEQNIFKTNSSLSELSGQMISSRESNESDLMRNISNSSTNSQPDSYPLSKFTTFGTLETLKTSNNIEQNIPQMKFKKKPNESIYSEIKNNNQNEFELVQKATNYIMESDILKNPSSSSSSVKIIKKTPIEPSTKTMPANLNKNLFKKKKAAFKPKINYISNSQIQTPNSNYEPIKNKLTQSVFQSSTSNPKNSIIQKNKEPLKNLKQNLKIEKSNKIEQKFYSKTTNSKLFEKLISERKRSKSKNKQTKNNKNFKKMIHKTNLNKNLLHLNKKAPLKFNKYSSRVIPMNNNESSKSSRLQEIPVTHKMKSNSPNRYMSQSNGTGNYIGLASSSVSNYDSNLQPKIIKKGDRKVIKTKMIYNPHLSSNRHERKS